MGRLFGTDGIRGIVNKDLTPELAFQIGRAGGYVLTRGSRKPKILVGMDTRISSEMLEAALCAGICSVGAEAVTVGIIPTPAIAYLVQAEKANAGVVISASHNSFEFNGIKFFNGNGFKLSDEIEERIERIILDKSENIVSPTHKGVGRIIQRKNLARKYINFTKSTIDCSLEGLKVIVDCSNGASVFVSPAAIRELGAEVTVIHNTPDGYNINDNCGSTHPEILAEMVKDGDFDIGVAFDGDADRLIAVDEAGNIVDGDQIMAMCALDLMKDNKLKDDTLVATVMSNLGLFMMGNEQGLNILQTKVGDRHVLEEMVKGGFNIGGEQSGHIILLEHNTTGDGLVTALQVMRIIKNSGKKLSELASCMTKYPQTIVNVKVDNKNKHKLDTDTVLQKAIADAHKEFEGTGRVLIRASGTEPLIRVMIEGMDYEHINRRAKELGDLILKRLG